MKNAHERFGRLAYQRRTEKTATNIRVFLDAFVGEERTVQPRTDSCLRKWPHTGA